MSNLITETFNLKNGKFKKKDGSEVPVVYIDPSTSENTYKYKDEIKKYGATWLTTLKTWGWFIGNNNPQAVFDKYIKPCLEYLTKVEQNPNNEERNVIAIIDKLLSELGSNRVEVMTNVVFDKEAVKNRLESFKQELVNIMSNEEFKAKMLPIIKFRQAQGHQYSLTNAILIYIQDPRATLVKSKRNWEAMNRLVKPNAPALALWVPIGGTPLSKAEKETITQRFLARRGAASVKDLNPGDKEELNVQLKPRVNGNFDLKACFFDVRYTEQMEGKEDLVGNRNTDELPWYDDKGEVTPETIKYCDAIIAIAKDRGIKVQYTADLGGARGVSKSGTIEVLKDVPKNSGLFNTLTHEYAHELLHQTYISKNDNNPNGYGQYFIGTKQGRAVVEQQAELTAWIVLRNFGFDMPTNINYVGLWGMDEKSAPFVFDTVAKVATTIIKDIYAKTNFSMKESKDNTNQLTEMTGLDVAKLIGCEDIYLRNKQRNNVDTQNRIDFQEEFKRVYEMLSARRPRR